MATDIAYNFTHNNIMLEPNAMNNMNTVAHMDVLNTQSTEHTARRSLMHNCVTSHLWLKSALHASSHPCMCTCVLRLGCFLLACPVLYFGPLFSFQAFLMFTSEFNERSRSNPCATSASGPWPLLTTRHPSHMARSAESASKWL